MNFREWKKQLYGTVAITTITLIIIYETSSRFEQSMGVDESNMKEIRQLDNTKRKNSKQTTVFNAMHMHNVEKFIKQLSLAKRFERHDELVLDMEAMANRLTVFLNVGNQKNVTEKNSKRMTIILNAVTEIQDLDGLLEDLSRISTSPPKWTKLATILLGLTEDSFNRHSSKLRVIKNRIPTLKWVVLDHGTLANTLFKLVEKATSRYVLLTKKLRKLPVDFNSEGFLGPLRRGSSNVVSGSLTYPDGRWESGCHQSKLIWSQLKIQHGTDVTYKGEWVKCDYMEGPFALKRKTLSRYLKNRLTLQDHLLYTELIYKMNFENQIMKVHLGTVFHVQDEHSLEKLSRNQWLGFIQRNEITEIFTTVATDYKDGGVKETHHEFDFKEARSRCSKYQKRQNMLKPRACIRELHFMLINSYKLFDRFGYTYTTEDGSGVAGTKLHDTIPWETDQDFAFRSQNMTSLYNNRAYFKEIGITLGPDIDVKAKCIADSSLAKQPVGACGYIGMHGTNWKMDNYGAHVLSGDYYQPWKLEAQFKNTFPPNRIHGHDSKVKMGDHWAQGRANPGLYIRSHYGLDILRHSKHWSEQGWKDSWGNYKTDSRFEECPEEGHHRCMNQYLSDGNIQFQRPWA